ncbi:TAXI family TRAP transporter solute-binding subunit [Hyphobacterium sp.]|uniref:TAXI family TRAP transporter solute-binding subunit n=1 Tax=Hyphobacterium sp. TaxID=2004662 RepID=UPI003BACED95
MKQLAKRWRDMAPGERGFWLAGVSVSLVVTILLVWLALTLDPAPPRQISILTGPAGGAYQSAGERLEQFLEAKGVEVELIPTAGSGENFARLVAADADAALIQGGVGDPLTAANRIRSLGALFYEPLWIFTTAGEPISDLRDLDGQRIAAGREDSGIRALLDVLLQENGVQSVTWSEAAGTAAAASLRLGEVDAAAFITSPDRTYIRDLLQDDAISVLSLPRSPAYSRLFPFLSEVTLYQGVIDLQHDIPPEDVQLIAPAAVAVVRSDLHPAVQSLLLQAMHEHFSSGSALAEPAAFPDRHLVDYPLSQHAARYYDRGGPAFLQRYLPFWAANLVDRVWILLIPVLTLMFPFMRIAPRLYSWQLKRRIKRFYRDLRDVERDVVSKENPGSPDACRNRLETIRADVRELKVPWTYFDEVYVLKTHIDFVEHLIDSQEAKGEDR